MTEKHEKFTKLVKILAITTNLLEVIAKEFETSFAGEMKKEVKDKVSNIIKHGKLSSKRIAAYISLTNLIRHAGSLNQYNEKYLTDEIDNMDAASEELYKFLQSVVEIK
jgi:hypothetical protein